MFDQNSGYPKDKAKMHSPASKNDKHDTLRFPIERG